MILWLFYALIGKTLIFVWQKFPLQHLTKSEFFLKLHACDLCSGVWIYTALALVAKVGLLAIFQLQTNQIIDQIITGCITSFVVWIFSAGWTDKFGTRTLIIK